MKVVALLVALAGVALAGCADGGSSPTETVDTAPGTGVIRGVVVDPTITPVAGVNVSVPAQGLSTRSDGDGLFSFQDVQPGLVFIEAAKQGYTPVQVSVEVVAGAQPELLKVQIAPAPGTEPLVVPLQLRGHLACGAAVFYTSVGCTTSPVLSSLTESQSIWSLDFDTLPSWTQGELLWDSTQAASGNFIWQIVQSEYPGSPQPHIGYMETEASPALAYLDTATIDGYAEWILDQGIDYRFFGGPHELCPAGVPEQTVNRFGCGLTVDQGVDAYIHHFYNVVPPEGWRFTADGEPTP